MCFVLSPGTCSWDTYEVLEERCWGIRALARAALSGKVMLWALLAAMCFQLWSMVLIKEGFCLWFREPLNIVDKHFLSIKGFPLISAYSQLPRSLGELCTWITFLINVTLFLMSCTFSAWLSKQGAPLWKRCLQCPSGIWGAALLLWQWRWNNSLLNLLSPSSF